MRKIIKKILLGLIFLVISVAIICPNASAAQLPKPDCRSFYGIMITLAWKAGWEGGEYILDMPADPWNPGDDGDDEDEDPSPGPYPGPTGKDEDQMTVGDELATQLAYVYYWCGHCLMTWDFRYGNPYTVDE